MGVQLFGGKFYKCIDSSHQILPVSLVANKTTCLEKGFRWENSNVNYDNVLKGLVALTQVVGLLTGCCPLKNILGKYFLIGSKWMI